MKSSVFELGYGRYEILDLLKDSTPGVFYGAIRKKFVEKNFYLRRVASKDPGWSYWYALIVDSGPHPLTREGASKDPEESYYYAFYVDKGPHLLTKERVKDSGWSYEYRFLR